MEHIYKTQVIWTGNKGKGTISAVDYERSHDIVIKNKPIIHGSSDTPFRGDATKHNPEDMFVSSLSVCHMLWYLHLCADAGIIVINYIDNAIGIMQEVTGGGGNFSEVILYPIVTIANIEKFELAIELHDKARQKCFIANSCNFSVLHKPTCVSAK